MTDLLLRQVAEGRAGAEGQDDFVIGPDGLVVGRIFKANAAPVGSPWMWTLAFGHHRTARRHTPHRLVTLQQGARVIEDSRRLRVV
jgi:hypothetical protein